jgi:Tfp pilus assembly protein PilN
MAEYEGLDELREPPPRQHIQTVRRTVVLQITALGLLALAAPLYLIFGQLRGDVTRLESEYANLNARLAALNTPAPEVQALTDQLAKLDALSGQLAAEKPPVGVNWPGVIAAIGDYDRAQITLLSLTQTENQLTLEGEAVSNDAVVAYVKSLSTAPLFASVEIQSIKLSTDVQSAHFVLVLIANP